MLTRRERKQARRKRAQRKRGQRKRAQRKREQRMRERRSVKLCKIHRSKYVFKLINTVQPFSRALLTHRKCMLSMYWVFVFLLFQSEYPVLTNKQCLKNNSYNIL